MPGAHFNPPPGWPVPPDWTPPADWEPDPSWPAAPPGWQFFIDAETPPEQVERPQRSRPSRRRGALIAGAIAFVVTLVAGTIAAVMWFRGSESAPPWPARMLTDTFPTQPQFAWSVQAASLLPGDNPQFATPKVTPDAPGGGTFVLGDRIITRVLAMAPGPEIRMAALRTADGHVDWLVPVNLGGCALTLINNGLACLAYLEGADYGEVRSIDVDTGKMTSTARVPFQANWIAADGDRLYISGVDKDNNYVVAAGSPENPLAYWKTTVSQDKCVTKNQRQLGHLRAAHGVVWGSNGFVGQAALHGRDGSPVFDHGVTGVMVADDGSSVAAVRCDGSPDQDGGVTDVVDGGGRPMFVSQDSLFGFNVVVRGGGPAPFITVSGDVLDPTTGQKRAHISLPGRQDLALTWGVGIIGNVAVLSGQEGGVTGYDLTTGKQLWQSATARLAGSVVTDGKYLLGASLAAGIDALTIADGTTAWSIPGPGQNSIRELYATDAGLLSVTPGTTGLLRPTGPPAIVPSINGDESTDGSGAPGGTRYVTKCGRTPKFVPEAIHTDSGALVIRMKIVAFCPGGDVLAAPDTRITVTSGGQNVAAGTFDLSTTPIVIPPDPGGSNSSQPSVEHDFSFPIGTFFRLPVSTNEIPSNGQSSQGPVDLGVKTLVVGCQESGSTTTTAPSPKTDSPATVPVSTATGPATPASGDKESASLDGLRAIAAADRPFVTTHLADHWVPQLSSKRPGTVDDGITWDNAAILQGHLKLRLQYPEARLLWSGDWSTFSAPNYWVTIAGVVFPNADGALAWCRDHHRDSDHCYAKLVSKTHPVDGSTAYNP